MAVAAFFLFCTFVVLFGLGFVILTLRHHHRMDRLRRNEAATPAGPAERPS